MLLSSIPDSSYYVFHEPLNDSLGCYLLEAGCKPCIVINAELKIGSDTFNLVYERLLEFHNSIPLDSLVRLFSWEWFYEELIPEKEPDPQPEIIFIGRFARHQAPCPVCISRARGYRLIG